MQTSKTIRIIIAMIVAVFGVTSIANVGVASEHDERTNPNHPSYWEDRTEHPSTCSYYSPAATPSTYGSFSDDGKAVVLNTFQASWPGDHWELLVVKSGSRDIGDGDGNKVYQHPTAGVDYYGPTNSGGQQGLVSHWIVCTGTVTNPTPTEVSWTATNGDCTEPDGSLAVVFDSQAATYNGDSAGTYPPGTEVAGTFAAKPGFALTDDSSPYAHTFTVAGEPCPTDAAPAPRFVDPTCAKRAVAVVDDHADDDITYEIVSGEAAPGKAVTVRAVPGEGIVLEGTTEWSHTFGTVSDADCVVQGTPSSSIVAECGAATLSFTNSVGPIEAGYTGATISFTYSIDGEDQPPVDVAPNATEVIDVEFGEDTGPHTVATGGDEVPVDSNCEPDSVTAAAPSFVEPTCAAPNGADVVLPTVAGVSYAVTGTPAPGAAVTVNATAGDGYVLAGTAAWQHAFATVDDEVCNPTESTVASAGPTTTVDTSGSGSPTTSLVTELPRTGPNGTTALAGIGAALLALGAILIGLARRATPA